MSVRRRFKICANGHTFRSHHERCEQDGCGREFSKSIPSSHKTPQTSKKYCKHFFYENCKFGQTCRNIHEIPDCKFKDLCRNKKFCRYRHNDDDDGTSGMNSAHASHKSSTRGNANKATSKTKICQNWDMNASCIFGDGCWYKHPGDEKTTSSSITIIDDNGQESSTMPFTSFTTASTSSTSSTSTPLPVDVTHVVVEEEGKIVSDKYYRYPL